MFFKWKFDPFSFSSILYFTLNLFILMNMNVFCNNSRTTFFKMFMNNRKKNFNSVDFELH